MSLLWQSFEQADKFRGMLISPFPDSVGFAVINIAQADESKISSQEQDIASRITNIHRRSHFIAGRIAARKAIASKGFPNTNEILKAENGMPIWPAGLIGSISHTTDTAVACVTLRSSFQIISLDIEEKTREIRDDIARRILTEDEQAWLCEEAQPENQLLCVFSAKECVYKGLYPICLTTMNFKDVELHFDKTENKFTAKLLKSFHSSLQVGMTFVINCSADEQFLLTSLVIP